MREAPLLLYTHRESGALFSRRWRLFVVDGVNRGLRVELTHSPALVGAAPAAALTLSDDTVSRYHAELDVFTDGIRVRDLDSTNGTFAEDGSRVAEVLVENGGAFRVGQTSVRLIAVDDAAGSEADTDPKGVPPGAVERFGDLVGVAARTRDLFRTAKKVAPSASSILLEGEEGTGKATLVREIHRRSARAAVPLLAFDVSRTPPERRTETLFGVRNAPGLIERSNHGTLFIDHVDHLDVDAQQALARTIRRGEIIRPADGHATRLDVRWIGAVERPPASLPFFEPELFRRLAVVHLRVAPFRARLDDAVAMADQLLARASPPRPRLGPRARSLLTTQRFANNGSDIQRAVGAIVEMAPQFAEGFEGLLVQAYLTDVLVARRGDVTAAAPPLGLDGLALFRRLATYEVDLEAIV